MCVVGLLDDGMAVGQGCAGEDDEAWMNLRTTTDERHSHAAQHGRHAYDGRHGHAWQL